MASQSLYRKWRSQTFDELVGQEEIVRTLKNALSGGKLAHAYLFTGPRGTGKTTTARLLAKTVNCTNPQDGEPCNECQQCREISAGTSFNVIEIDAASNRGIDSIRDLREKVMMPPSTGKYKVYVLDEAHMLTTEAFNALLKTLEEPPGYVIFVLATTDVHKMLPTVLSRCQRFDFKRFSMRQIVQHLNFVAGQEHIKLERPAAELIARAAAGGMRDALSLLDQAIAYCGEEVGLAQVQAMLGLADPRAISRLIGHVAGLDSSGGLHLIHTLAEEGADLRQINAQVTEYWRALMLARAGADVATILDVTGDEAQEIAQVARSFELEELTECARICAQNDLMQKNQGTPQLALELAFLECVALHRRFQSGQPTVAPAASASQARTVVAETLPSPSPTNQATWQAIPPAPSRRQPEGKAPASLPDWDDLPRAVDGPEPVTAGEKAAGGKATQESVAASTGTPLKAEGGAPTLTVAQVKGGWENVMKRVKQRKQSSTTAAMLKFFDVVRVEGTAEQAIVVIQAQKQGYYNYVNEQDRYKDVEWGMMMEFGRPCRVRLLPPGQAGSTSGMATPWEASSYSTSVAPAIVPAPAHLERPDTPPPASSTRAEQPGAIRQVQEEQAGYAGTSVDPNVSSVPPLARSEDVSENTRVLPLRETLEQKARRDPVVQEVMKTFTAKIVNVQPRSR